MLAGTGIVTNVFGASALAQQLITNPSNYVEELVYRAQRLLNANPPDVTAAAPLLIEAAKAENPVAMLLLARLYATGQGVTADFATARDLFRKAIVAEVDGLDTAWASLGELYRLAGAGDRDPALAVEAYRKAAALGNTGVILPLAIMIGAGDGVPADLDGAAELLLQAPVATKAERTAAAEAWADLGDLYVKAGGTANQAGAVKAYQQALQFGSTRPLIPLGRLIGTGAGAPADFAAALQLVNQAIRLGGDGQGGAYVALGDLYRNAAPELRDLVRAAEAYQKAIDLGDTDAILELASLYAVGGEGLPPDPAKARSLFDMAIALGGSKATAAWLALGDLYRSADGPFRDLFRAAMAYDQAAAGGDVIGMIKLARMRATGDGVAVDLASAKALLERAIAAGTDTSGVAWSLLGDVEIDPANPDRDPAAAQEAFAKAVQLGDAHAMVRLAQMLITGGDLPKDEQRAKTLLEAAVATGGDFGVGGMGDARRSLCGVRIAVRQRRRSGQGLPRGGEARPGQHPCVERPRRSLQ